MTTDQWTAVWNNSTSTSTTSNYLVTFKPPEPGPCNQCFGTGGWCSEHDVAMEDPEHDIEDNCDLWEIECSTCKGKGMV